MEVEQVVNSLGGFGRFQLFVTILAYFTVLFCSQHVVQDSFINYTPNHRCFVPSCDSANTSYEEPFLNFTTPTEDSHWSSCSHFQRIGDAGSNWATTEGPASNDGQTQRHHKTTGIATLSDEECSKNNFDEEKTEDCNAGWVYDHELFTSTTTTQFDLTCGRAYLTSLTTSAYSFGMLLGAGSIGVVSDKFGRKVAFMLSLVLTVCGGLAGALSVNAIMLVLARVPTGIGAVGLFECAFILSAEFMPQNLRSTVGLLINVTFALGEALVGVYAIFIRDWRALQLTIVLPSAVLGLYIWFMPESLRWLIHKERREEARQLIEKVAKINKIDAPDCSFLNKIPEASEDKPKKSRSAFDLLRSPNMRKRTLNMFFIWIVVNMVYYGLSQNAVNLGGNIFTNFISMMLIEVPSYFLAALLFDRMGHKGTLAFTLLLAGVSCVATGFLSRDATTAIIVLSLVGKLGGAAAFAIIYVYACEIFPTEYRSIGVGICSMFARFGGILSPLVASMGKNQPELPNLIFGFLACISVVSVLFLPETVGCPLPETLEESELLGSEQSMWYFSCQCPRSRPTEHSNLEKRQQPTVADIDDQDNEHL